MNHTFRAHAQAELGDTVIRLDALSQSGFGAIAAMARGALGGLEASGGTYPSPDALAAVLDAIWDKAEQFGNEINVKAEEAGCN